MFKRIFALSLCWMLLLSACAEETPLRVLLRSPGDLRQMHVTLCGPYSIPDLPALSLCDGAELTLSEENDRVFLASGGLKLDVGPSLTLNRESSDAYLFLSESEKPNAYSGSLRISADGGFLRPVLHIPLEDYLCGVVAYEMSNAFPLDALKAQSVAARTYALRKQSASLHRDYDLTDTPSDQVFKGFDPAHQNVLRAVRETAGVYGTCGDHYADCFYTASNGGQIARPRDVWGGEGGPDSLRNDPYDVENPRSLVNSIRFKADLSDCAVLRNLLSDALDPSLTLLRVTDITPIRPEPADSLRFTALRFSLAVQNASGESLSAAAELPVFSVLKDALSLGLNRSDCELIRARAEGDGFVLEMRRFGHGCGMSQRGAQWMAGHYQKSWIDILRFYYPDMVLNRCPD